MHNMIIGTSYYHRAKNFRNPVGITPGIPSGLDFPEDRNFKWLSLDYDWVDDLKHGRVSREDFKKAYHKYLIEEFGSVEEAVEAVIEKHGPRPVLLACQGDASQCYRSILAELIQEDTDYVVKEVKTQSDLLETDFKEWRLKCRNNTEKNNN